MIFSWIFWLRNFVAIGRYSKSTDFLQGLFSNGLNVSEKASIEQK
jgi:hypothetical protein